MLLGAKTRHKMCSSPSMTFDIYISTFLSGRENYSYFPQVYLHSPIYITSWGRLEPQH